ncbi:MAG TPA: DUF559 domain-containing protein [Caulobacterales bacterium]|nr:DUF559 domain-containing protein [Caulobacterales bacterium]
MRNPGSIERAKRNRGDPTSTEARMWALLRDRRYRAFKFRRQHAIGPYVVDFACVAERLVIEVDGPSHDRADQRAFDAERTAFLERAGWRVVRMSTADVYAGIANIAPILDAALKISE